MNIYLNYQAKSMIESGNLPFDSIGVFKTDEGFSYWYCDGFTFDSGVEQSEKQALRTAKKNWR